MCEIIYPEEENGDTIKSTIDLADEFCFEGFDVSGDCMIGAQYYMTCIGQTNFGSRLCVYLLGYESTDNNGNHVFNIYSNDRLENAIESIDDHLEDGSSIIVGLDYKDGTLNEGTTDHFVVVTGRGYDTTEKQYYYTYVETARYSSNSESAISTTTNRLYYDSTNHTFGGDRSFGTDAYYNVTQVRPNNGECTGTQSY